MGYTPKYARENSRVSPLGALITVVAALVCLALTAMLLWAVAGIPGGAGQPVQAAAPAIGEKFEAHMDSALADAMTVFEAPALENETAPEETVPVETEPVVRPVYTLKDSDLVAPEPDQSKFGQTEDPSTMTEFLMQVQKVHGWQPMYFSTEVEIFSGSKVMYYLDDTIAAITWKEVHDGSVYTFSEVKIAHPSQFRRFLADGIYGSDKQYTTTEMAESVNAVVASSGDFHRFRSFGICVYEGQVKKVEGTYAETCYIDDKGDLIFTYGGDLTTTAKSQEFVDAKNIRFSLCFGPILVDDYEIVDHTWYGVGEITEGYARAALCQMGDLHYIVATANTEGPNQEIPTVRMFQRNIAATGCRMAYCLDGGQTAAIVMNDQLINRPVYGTQRKISDIIYFATAIPEEE